MDDEIDAYERLRRDYWERNPERAVRDRVRTPLEWAVIDGDLDGVRRYAEITSRVDPGAMAIAMAWAAGDGKLEILQTLCGVWVRTPKHRRIKPGLLGSAARFGQLEVMRWVQEQPEEDLKTVKNTALNVAASNGRLEAVRWLLGHRREVCDVEDALSFVRGSTDRADVVALLEEARRHGP